MSTDAPSPSRNVAPAPTLKLGVNADALTVPLLMVKVAAF